MFESTTSQPIITYILKVPIIINRTAAALAAAAIYEIFPGSELFGGGETDTGFFYQFFYSHPLPPEASRLLEERMRQIVREDRPLRETEMVACSARELFLKEDHVAAVDALSDMGPKQLVSLIRIGSFSDLAEGPFCESVQEVAAFQITAVKNLGEQGIQIEGTAFPSKKELKDFLKLLAKYEEENHLERGQGLKFWQWREGKMLWLPKGLKAREGLLRFLKKRFDGVELKASSEGVVDAYCQKRMPMKAVTVHEEWKDPEEGSGLFEEGCQSIFQQSIYCSEKELKEFSISLLQIIDKTLIILGFNASARLVGQRRNEKELKRLEEILGLKAEFTTEKLGSGTPEGVRFWGRTQWFVEDGLGRERIAFELNVIKVAECMILRLKVGVEKILALLLEQTKIDLQLIENWVKKDFEI